MAFEFADAQDFGNFLVMRVLIITSCTGEKSVDHDQRLTLADFAQGSSHIADRHLALKDLLSPAESLYSGMQHLRLMRGVSMARKSSGLQVDLHIVSAGYGLVSCNQLLAPYEATFLGMKKVEARDWAQQLDIANSVRAILGAPYDLGLLLLGDDYLAACDLNENVTFGGPTFLFCGSGSAKRLPNVANLFPVVLSNADTKRFACGQVGIKGEVAARVLEKIATQGVGIDSLIAAPQGLLDRLVEGEATSRRTRSPARANSAVDHVIQIPDSWRRKPHRNRLAYFIPDWDDQVDPDFDFTTETHSGGTGDWSNQVYAHQMFKEPNYDGILISKIVAEQSKKKAERINRLGVHRHLRVPRDFPIMGDCGAFGYINEYEPPFNTSEILDYYTRLDFDYGVSIDHFAIGEGEDRKRRYDLTIENARDFIVEHKKLGLSWTPIGAVQGASAPSASYRMVALRLSRSRSWSKPVSKRCMRLIVASDQLIRCWIRSMSTISWSPPSGRTIAST